MTKKSPKPYTGKRILVWIVGFFLIIFLANGIMAYFALKTWPGLETEDAYVKGLNYNQQITNAKEQEISKWQISIITKPETQTNGRFEVSIIRPDGSLPPMTVTANFIRAVQEGYDQEIILSHMGNDLYGATVDFPLNGQWNILIVVKSQESIIYKFKDWVLVS